MRNDHVERPRHFVSRGQYQDKMSRHVIGVHAFVRAAKGRFAHVRWVSFLRWFAAVLVRHTPCLIRDQARMLPKSSRGHSNKGERRWQRNELSASISVRPTPWSQ